MNREIKFRAWFPSEARMTPPSSIPTLCKRAADRGHGLQDELILLQYTGLKDKNGKEIYDGDIIASAYDPKRIGSVEFKLGCFMWDSEPLCYDLGSSSVDIAPPNGWAEVIGNIYENPELLNQGEKEERSVATES